jgi:hypothetical protein
VNVPQTREVIGPAGASKADARAEPAPLGDGVALLQEQPPERGRALAA